MKKKKLRSGPKAKKPQPKARRATSRRSKTQSTLGHTENDHGPVVAECEYFTLYEDGYLTSSKDVERAYLRCMFGISARKGQELRLEMALALWDLMLEQAGQFREDKNDLLRRLSDSLGRKLLEVYNAYQKRNPSTALSSARNAVKAVVSAIGQFHRYRGTIPLPGDRSPGAWTWAIQDAAKRIFRETKQLPAEWRIWADLEAEGWIVRGHDAKKQKRDKLIAAGLPKICGHRNLPT